MVSSAHLSCGGVGVDGDLAGAAAVAVHRGGHLLPADDGPDLLLGRDKLSGLSPLQGLVGESRVLLHLRPGEEIPSPGGTIPQTAVNLQTFLLKPNVLPYFTPFLPIWNAQIIFFRPISWRKPPPSILESTDCWSH